MNTEAAREDHDTTQDWLQASEGQNGLNYSQLITVFQTYQARQAQDLDLTHRYANYYTVILTALLTATVVAIVQLHGSRMALFLSALPLTSILLIHKAKLTSFRFYRRYIEGKVRLTKLEHALGLSGVLHLRDVNPIPKHPRPWQADPYFLPARYANQAGEWRRSAVYIRVKPSLYGLGLLTQTTFEVFYLASWVLILMFPLLLSATGGCPANCTATWLYGPSLVAALIGGASAVGYWQLRREMEDETLKKSELGFSTRRDWWRQHFPCLRVLRCLRDEVPGEGTKEGADPED